jgi:calcium-dependent protein kinase
MGCVSSKKKVDIEGKKKGGKDVVNISASAFLSKTKGKLSNNYTIIKKLGSGAFADVQLCLFKPLNQQRAVKMIHKAGLHQQQMDQDYMLKEISILTSLDHPNILKCYEIFEDNWKFYVAMDYCAGGELFDKIIQMKKFNELQAAEIIFQVLSAIAYCHSKGVTHRDLKPENILLEDKEGGLSLKVADFGSSSFIDSKRKLSGCFGSAYYVAPEVLQGQYNEKCDIWSVGVIMYILLTGKPPYKGSDERVIMDQVKNTPLQVEGGQFNFLSRDSINLLQSLLIVDPSSRISARDALNHPWIQSFRQRKECPDLSNALQELSTFSSSVKLKNAVHLFLASQAISHEELKVLKEEFINLDKNGDGKISKSELIEQYRKTMDKDEANEIVTKIMKEVDSNHSGDIDYTEFLAACMNTSNFNSRTSLETAFQMFDKDGSGDITIDEIRAVLGSKQILDTSVWNEILAEVDQNGDGVIDLKEFIVLMTRKFTS